MNTKAIYYTPRKMPKHTGKIKPGDPFVYLDEDESLVWMSPDGPQYMNDDGMVGGAHFDTPIIKRLGKFKGLAIEPCVLGADND